MAAAGIFIALAGVGLKIASDVKAANAQQQAAEATAKGYDHDAEVASMNADITRAQTSDDSVKMGVMARRSLGSMSAAYGTAGVTRSGSVLDVLADSAATAQMDIANAKRQGDLKVQSLADQAKFDRRKAFFYRNAGGDAAAALGLNVGGDIAKAYPTISQYTGTTKVNGVGGEY